MPWENNRPTHVPTKTRDQALARDGHQCTARMNNGDRCPETTSLEAAHLNAWQAGETITTDDVRTLCAWHHNRETQTQAATARAKARKQRPPDAHPTETHPAYRPKTPPRDPLPPF